MQLFPFLSFSVLYDLEHVKGLENEKVRTNKSPFSPTENTAPERLVSSLAFNSLTYTHTTSPACQTCN